MSYSLRRTIIPPGIAGKAGISLELPISNTVGSRRTIEIAIDVVGFAVVARRGLAASKEEMDPQISQIDAD